MPGAVLVDDQDRLAPAHLSMDGRQYEIDGFRIDPRQRMLYSLPANRPVDLQPRVFDALVYFVERPGELLGKRELLQALWPNVVVEENSLNQVVSQLRKALGEKPSEHRYIVTSPGRGYRFVAAVRSLAYFRIAVASCFDQNRNGSWDPAASDQIDSGQAAIHVVGGDHGDGAHFRIGAGNGSKRVLGRLRDGAVRISHQRDQNRQRGRLGREFRDGSQGRNPHGYVACFCRGQDGWQSCRLVAVPQPAQPPHGRERRRQLDALVFTRGRHIVSPPHPRW